MNNKKKDSKKAPTRKAIYTGRIEVSDTDPNGSYTGVSEDKEEKPVQDADDL